MRLSRSFELNLPHGGHQCMTTIYLPDRIIVQPKERTGVARRTGATKEVGLDRTLPLRCDPPNTSKLDLRRENSIQYPEAITGYSTQHFRETERDK